MQSVHSRMRRAVEKENKDIATKMGDSKKPKRKQRLRKKFNLFLVLLLLSPILIIGAIVFVLQQYTIWSAADADLQNVTPGKMDLANQQNIKRLRNSRTAIEGRDEKRIVSNAEIRRKMKGNIDKQIGAEGTNDRPTHKFLVLVTKHGNIKITLRPDLSQGSVDYIYKLVESYGGKRCMHCSFYRSEKPAILQGIMENKDVVPINEVLGTCPPGSEGVSNECPEWDKKCGCHGPVMTRGAVAWAAGQAGGPDFFVDADPDPADWWGTQHTNFGIIEDKASLKIIDDIFELPVEKTPDMYFLKDPIHFDLILE